MPKSSVAENTASDPVENKSKKIITKQPKPAAITRYVCTTSCDSLGHKTLAYWENVNCNEPVVTRYVCSLSEASSDRDSPLIEPTQQTAPSTYAAVIPAEAVPAFPGFCAVEKLSQQKRKPWEHISARRQPLPTGHLQREESNQATCKSKKLITPRTWREQVKLMKEEDASAKQVPGVDSNRSHPVSSDILKPSNQVKNIGCVSDHALKSNHLPHGTSMNAVTSDPVSNCENLKNAQETIKIRDTADTELILHNGSQSNFTNEKVPGITISETTADPNGPVLTITSLSAALAFPGMSHTEDVTRVIGDPEGSPVHYQNSNGQKQQPIEANTPSALNIAVSTSVGQTPATVTSSSSSCSGRKTDNFPSRSAVRHIHSYPDKKSTKANQSSPEAPIKKCSHDRNKAREYMLKQKQKRRERFIMEQKKKELEEELKKAKLQALKEKTRRLVRESIKHTLEKHITPETVNAVSTGYSDTEHASSRKYDSNDQGYTDHTEFAHLLLPCSKSSLECEEKTNAGSNAAENVVLGHTVGCENEKSVATEDPTPGDKDSSSPRIKISRKNRQLDIRLRTLARAFSVELESGIFSASGSSHPGHSSLNASREDIPSLERPTLTLRNTFHLEKNEEEKTEKENINSQSVDNTPPTKLKRYEFPRKMKSLTKKMQIADKTISMLKENNLIGSVKNTDREQLQVTHSRADALNDILDQDRRATRRELFQHQILRKSTINSNFEPVPESNGVKNSEMLQKEQRQHRKRKIAVKDTGYRLNHKDLKALEVVASAGQSSAESTHVPDKTSLIEMKTQEIIINQMDQNKTVSKLEEEKRREIHFRKRLERQLEGNKTDHTSSQSKLEGIKKMLRQNGQLFTTVQQNPSYTCADIQEVKPLSDTPHQNKVNVDLLSKNEVRFENEIFTSHPFTDSWDQLVKGLRDKKSYNLTTRTPPQLKRQCPSKLPRMEDDNRTNAGKGNISELFSQAVERQRKEMAAIKIQSAYRGYRARKFTSLLLASSNKQGLGFQFQQNPNKEGIKHEQKKTEHKPGFNTTQDRGETANSDLLRPMMVNPCPYNIMTAIRQKLKALKKERNVKPFRVLEADSEEMNKCLVHCDQEAQTCGSLADNTAKNMAVQTMGQEVNRLPLEMGRSSKRCNKIIQTSLKCKQEKAEWLENDQLKTDTDSFNCTFDKYVQTSSKFHIADSPQVEISQVLFSANTSLGKHARPSSSETDSCSLKIPNICLQRKAKHSRKNKIFTTSTPKSSSVTCIDNRELCGEWLNSMPQSSSSEKVCSTGVSSFHSGSLKDKRDGSLHKVSSASPGETSIPTSVQDEVLPSELLPTSDTVKSDDQSNTNVVTESKSSRKSNAESVQVTASEGKCIGKEKNHLNDLLKKGMMLPPEALHLQFQAELQLLESLEESRLQIAHIEGLHAVSVAQQTAKVTSRILQEEKNQHKQSLTDLQQHTTAEHEQMTKMFDQERKEFQMILESIRKDVPDSQHAPVKDESSKDLPSSKNGSEVSVPPDTSSISEHLENYTVSAVQSVAGSLHQLSDVSFKYPSEEYSGAASSTTNPSGNLRPVNNSATVMSTIKDEKAKEYSFTKMPYKMYEELIHYEELQANEHSGLLDMKERTILDRTKVDMTMLELKKKKLREQGKENLIPSIKKRQRALLLKLEHARDEINRQRKAYKAASEERKSILLKHMNAIRSSCNKKKDVHVEKAVSEISSLNKTSENDKTETIRSDRSNPSATQTSNSATSQTEVSSSVPTEMTRRSSRSTILTSEGSSVHGLDASQPELKNASVCSNVCKAEASAQTSSSEGRHRLLPNKRLWNFEELSEWQHWLEEEKKRLQGGSCKVLQDRSTSPLKEIMNQDIALQKVSNTESVVTESQKSSSNIPSDTPTARSSTSSKTSEKQETDQPPEELHLSKSQTVVSLPSDVRIDSALESAQSLYRRQSEITIRTSPLILPRRHSSGSDESIVYSQTETPSEQSDLEGRVSALREQLRRRKLEAERLLREQKRARREKLKAKEQSLLKQIEVLDMYIARTKEELEQDFDASTVSVVKPKIKQPRVKEQSSRHVLDISVDRTVTPADINSEKLTLSDISSETVIMSPASEKHSSVAKLPEKVDASVHEFGHQTQEKFACEILDNSSHSNKGDTLSDNILTYNSQQHSTDVNKNTDSDYSVSSKNVASVSDSSESYEKSSCKSKSVMVLPTDFHSSCEIRSMRQSFIDNETSIQEDLVTQTIISQAVEGENASSLHSQEKSVSVLTNNTLQISQCLSSEEPRVQTSIVSSQNGELSKQVTDDPTNQEQDSSNQSLPNEHTDKVLESFKINKIAGNKETFPKEDVCLQSNSQKSETSPAVSSKVLSEGLCLNETFAVTHSISNKQINSVGKTVCSSEDHILLGEMEDGSVGEIPHSTEDETAISISDTLDNVSFVGGEGMESRKVILDIKEVPVSSDLLTNEQSDSTFIVEHEEEFPECGVLHTNKDTRLEKKMCLVENITNTIFQQLLNESLSLQWKSTGLKISEKLTDFTQKDDTFKTKEDISETHNLNTKTPVVTIHQKNVEEREEHEHQELGSVDECVASDTTFILKESTVNCELSPNVADKMLENFFQDATDNILNVYYAKVSKIKDLQMSNHILDSEMSAHKRCRSDDSDPDETCTPDKAIGQNTSSEVNKFTEVFVDKSEVRVMPEAKIPGSENLASQSDSTKLDVSRRVQEILSARLGNDHERSRIQDLLVTAYGVTSPEGSPPPGSPSKPEVRGIFKSASEQQKVELSGGRGLDNDAFSQDWFDDDFGLSRTRREAEELRLQQLRIEHEIQQLQQEAFLYVREIPNKPPPPYTPPRGQAPPQPPATGVPSCREDMAALVSEAARLLTAGPDWPRALPDRPPPDFCAGVHSAFRRFVFDLSRSLVNEALGLAGGEGEDAEDDGRDVPLPEELVPSRPGVRSREAVRAYAARQAAALFGLAGGGGASLNRGARRRLAAGPRWKRRDYVDELLVREAREEEPAWTDYRRDEVRVKLAAADQLLQDLLQDTASAVAAAVARKASHRPHNIQK